MNTARMHYNGGKGKSYQHIINLMPPHRRYIETHLGAGAVLRHKRAATINIAIDLDPAAIARMQHHAPSNVELIRADAVDVLKRLVLTRQDLIYCDPPYYPTTRRRPRSYRFDYLHEDHERLLALLVDLDCRIVLSGYDNLLYQEMLSSWHRTDYPSMTHRGIVLESAWTNFAPGPPLHDYSFIGADFRERERYRRRSRTLAQRISGMDALELHAALADLAARQPQAVLAAAERIGEVSQ